MIEARIKSYQIHTPHEPMYYGGNIIEHKSSPSYMNIELFAEFKPSTNLAACMNKSVYILSHEEYQELLVNKAIMSE